MSSPEHPYRLEFPIHLYITSSKQYDVYMRRRIMYEGVFDYQSIHIYYIFSDELDHERSEEYFQIRFRLLLKLSCQTKH